MSGSGETVVSRTLVALAVAALVVTFAWRAYLVFHEPLNEDESDMLHRTWEIGHEGVLYVDTFEVRTPLLFQVARPLLWLGRPSLIYLGARLAELLLSAAVFWFLFLFADALAGRRAALWTVILISFFNYFAERCVQVRAEPLMLALSFASLWQWARWRAGERDDRAAACSGLLLGLAVMTKVSAVFVALGPAAVWFVDLLLTGEDRRRALRGFVWWSASAVAAGVVVMVWTCGLRAGDAVTWMLRNGALFRFSETFRGGTWFVVRTFYTNPMMWLALVVGFFLLPLQLPGARRRWTVLLLVALGWAGVISVVARRVPFEQDLVLPAMLFAPAGGILLARVLPLGGGRRRWLGATAAALVFAALVGFAGVEARYHLRYAATTIRVYEGVLAPFIGAPGPDEPARQLDGKALMDFLRGEYDRVHYYPTRSLAQNLKLADFVARAVPPGGVVFTDAGLAIVRPEAHHVIKASVLYYLALLEQKDTGEANCRSVRRFMPGACDPGQPPGQRLLAVLLASNPELIVFGYGVIDVIDKFPETRGWYLGGYTTWYDPAVNAFVGLRTGHGWPAKPN